MSTSIEDYAALSTAAYNTARLEFNQLVLPTGWSQIDVSTNPVKENTGSGLLSMHPTQIKIRGQVYHKRIHTTPSRPSLTILPTVVKYTPK